MKDKSCPFCSWTGPANSFPGHLPRCPGSDRGEALPDGGRQLAYDPDRPGEPRLVPFESERCVDKRAASGANREVLVLDTFPESRADEFHVDEIDATVADVNDEYAPGAPVVAAVYLNELKNAGLLDGAIAAVRNAVDAGEVDVYHFPAPRLTAGEPQEVNE